MRRLRFSSGLILGLVLGIPAGLLTGVLLVPPRTPDQTVATSLQVQELTHRLEAAQEEKQRVDRQLEQFEKLADQMTASFRNLEQRFKALEEEQRIREAHGTRPAPPAPVPQAPAMQAPVAQAPPKPADATPTQAAPREQQPAEAGDGAPDDAEPAPPELQ